MGNKIGRRRQVVDEKYARPQGLHQHRDVDHKKLWKLILDSLAPCYPGDEESSLDLEECPICFLYYPRLNRSRIVQEEHWVIEAQIKMQQQELQDEAERIQKRKDASSLGRIVTAGGVEYHDSSASLLSVPSLRFPAQSDGQFLLKAHLLCQQIDNHHTRGKAGRTFKSEQNSSSEQS